MERQFLLFMLKETEYNFYYKLKKQSVHKTEVPKTVINSNVFSNLVNSGIVGKEKVGRETQRQSCYTQKLLGAIQKG